MSATTLALVAAGVAGLGTLYVKDNRREKSRRALSFEGCRGYLENERVTLEDTGYPKVTGRYHGTEVEIRLAVDTIQLRKLPVLWLMVTVQRSVPVAGVVDIMTRATNSEIFSPHNDLPVALPLPQGWPNEINIRTDDPQAAGPVLDKVADHVQAFVADNRGKEMLITPRGVRLVHRLCESDRGHYLMTRLPRFDGDQVPFETVEPLIQQAIAVAESLKDMPNDQAD